MWETRNEYKVLVEKPEGMKPLGRPGRTWQNNIKIGLKEVERGYSLKSLSQGKVQWRDFVKKAMNFLVPQNADGEFLDQLSSYQHFEKDLARGVR